MKYLHKIIIGTPSKKPSVYCYNYGNTKNIKIAMSKKGASIEVMLSRKHSTQELLQKNHLFADAIKKVLLVYLVKYSKSLTLKTMMIQIGEIVHEIEDIPQVHSMVQSELQTKMDIGWNKEKIIQDILWFTKSTSKQRMASLYALLIAKSRKFANEKFLYFWMAFNGMYGYYSNLIKRQHPNLNRILESDELKYFQLLQEWGDAVLVKKDKLKICSQVKALIVKLNSNLNREFFESEEGFKFSNQIMSILSENDVTGEITGYGFLITQFAYWFRCNFFHANNPVKLFVFQGDDDLNCIEKINNLLEEFLDDNLYKWFDKDYRDNYLKVKAQQLEITNKAKINKAKRV